MPNEKDAIQRKLDAARVKLLEADEAYKSLLVQMEPLNKRLADSQRDRTYLQKRIEKLTKMLAEF